jgi:hypothetical protein
MPTKYSSKRAQVKQWKEPSKHELYNIVEICMQYAEGYKWALEVQQLFGFRQQYVMSNYHNFHTNNAPKHKPEVWRVPWFAQSAGSDSPSSASRE